MWGDILVRIHSPYFCNSHMRIYLTTSGLYGRELPFSKGEMCDLFIELNQFSKLLPPWTSKSIRNTGTDPNCTKGMQARKIFWDPENIQTFLPRLNPPGCLYIQGPLGKCSSSSSQDPVATILQHGSYGALGTVNKNPEEWKQWYIKLIGNNSRKEN